MALKGEGEPLLADTQNSLGALAQKQKKFSNAEGWYLKSLKTREDLNAATVKEVQEQQQFLAQSYTSLGNLYSDMTEYDKVTLALSLPLALALTLALTLILTLTLTLTLPKPQPLTRALTLNLTRRSSTSPTPRTATSRASTPRTPRWCGRWRRRRACTRR